MEAGKKFSVQEGFDVGYAEATIAGFNWGVARGITRFKPDLSLQIIQVHLIRAFLHQDFCLFMLEEDLMMSLVCAFRGLGLIFASNDSMEACGYHVFPLSDLLF